MKREYQTTEELRNLAVAMVKAMEAENMEFYEKANGMYDITNIIGRLFELDTDDKLEIDEVVKNEVIRLTGEE